MLLVLKKNGIRNLQIIPKNKFGAFKILILGKKRLIPNVEKKRKFFLYSRSNLCAMVIHVPIFVP